MKKFFKVLSSVTLATLLIAACGTADDNENVGGSPDTGYEDRGDAGEGSGEFTYDGSIAVELVAKENGDVTYEFQMTNETDEDIELSFSSLQEYDYILKDEARNTVYQYSDDRMFGEAFVEKTIAANDTYVVEVDLSEALEKLEDGTYTLEVWSVANELDGLSDRVEVSFTMNLNDAVITKTGTYVGQIDNNSVEIIDADGNERAYRLTEEVREFLEVIEENDPVTFSYYEKDNGQLILTKVIVD